MTFPIRLPHLTWRQRAALGIGVAGIGVVGGIAGPLPDASATDANVSYAQDCTNGIVIIESHWEGVTHYTIDAPENVKADLAGYATVSVRLGFNGARSFDVRVASSNGHLHGELTHTFTRSTDCTGGVPTTAPPPPVPTTTCSQAIPVRDDCGPPTTPPVETTVPVATTTKVCLDGNPPSVPVEDGSLVCPEFGAPPAPTVPTVRPTAPQRPPMVPTTVARKPGALPATGNGQIIAGVAVATLFAGSVLWYVGRRRRPLGD